jgi:hypothetical protein
MIGYLFFGRDQKRVRLSVPTFLEKAEKAFSKKSSTSILHAKNSNNIYKIK